MRGLLLFLHILGFTWWLGGGMAAMVAGLAAKNFAPDERLAVYRGLSALARMIVAPGAFLVLGTGVMLMLSSVESDAAPPAWLGLMTGAGLVGALIMLVVVVPTAAKLGRLTPDPRGDLPETFTGLRKRHSVFATIAGMLGLIALVAGTVLR
jgi:putative copper export protein